MTPELSERFEMRLTPSVLEKVDTWRAHQSDVPSRSEAIRRLVETGLSAASDKKQIKLSNGEKLILIMLCELFQQLKLKSDIEPRFIQEVIYGGHFWGLDWRYPGIFHGHEDNAQVLSEVVGILDMWSFIERGFADLSKKEKERVATEAEPFGQYVVFSGFDGNGEAEYINIARFLIDSLGRFTSFKGRDLDAHLPTIDTYRRMLAVFEPLRPKLAGRELGASEIIDILKAKLHPSRRRS